MTRALYLVMLLAAAPLAEAREESKPKQGDAASVQKKSKTLEEKAPDKPAADPLLAAKAAYADKRPESFLVDPQLLLGVSEREERLSFLNYHAADSAIDLFVYLYRADQKPPQDWHDNDWVDKIFGGARPAVVVFYHVGKPQASTIRLTRQLAEKVSMPEQRRALENAVMAALKKSDRAGQFQAFLVQISTRIYWMESMMGGDKGETPAPSVTVEQTEKKSAAKRMEKIQPLIDMLMPYLVPAASAITSILLLCSWIAVRRARAKYRFPEFEVEPRLGGPHAAGVGSVISFGRAAPSPAFQREQLPEYLRRA